MRTPTDLYVWTYPDPDLDMDLPGERAQQACPPPTPHLTRLLSASIRCTLKARATVTARGRPSGTATTRMVTLVMR